eukprot:4624096-Pyramimonas_sp.AAC.1
MTKQLETGHARFLDGLAGQVHVAADAHLLRGTWRHIKTMLVHGARRGGPSKSSDVLPFVAAEGVPDPSSPSSAPRAL